MKEVFGLLAVVIGIAGGIPYVYGILKGTTHPHRVSWAIWALLGTITLVSYIAKGGRWSALLAVAAAFNNLVIFILSLKYGVGGSSRFDRVAFGLGLLGVLLWVLTREAAYALVFTLSADGVATFLTVKKARNKPNSESALAWSMATFASLCGLLAVHTYTFWQTIYPSYALIGGACLAFFSLWRRKDTAKSSI